MNTAWSSRRGLLPLSLRGGLGQLLATTIVFGIACGQWSPGGRDDPNRPGLAFAEVPASVTMNGRMNVVVRINDRDGRPMTGTTTDVTIRAVGSGTLSGTLTRKSVEGRAVFDDLSYDTWEPLVLRVSAPGHADAIVRSPIRVAPVMRFARTPPQRLLTGGASGPFVVELVDGRGRPVPANQPVRVRSADRLRSRVSAERRFVEGVATFDSLTFQRSGARTLVWSSPNVSDLILAARVHEGQLARAVWLPAARADVPYGASLPAGGREYHLVRGELPKGLRLNQNGGIDGLPIAAEHVTFDVLATPATGAPIVWRAELSVYPSEEPSTPTIDEMNVDGPYDVGAMNATIPVPVRRVTLRARIFYPARGGRVAEGSFPLVVFHHGAAPFDPRVEHLYDKYDHLLRRWASHGFVVATVDSPDLVWQRGRVTSGTMHTLSAMSENQRATIVHLRERNSDAAFPLRGHINADRVIVAGHSRGAAASLITARVEPSVVGGVLIKPVDPMTAIGGEPMWSSTLPIRPFLLVLAADDSDVPYPMADYLFERRAGPMVAVTLFGSNHFLTTDLAIRAADGEGTISREEDSAVTNAYAVSFLRYAANGDMDAATRLFGPAGLISNLSSGGVAVHADRMADALIVDNYQDESPGRNSLGHSDSDANLTDSRDEPSLLSALASMPAAFQRMYRRLYEAPGALARSNAHRLVWERAGAAYRLQLGGLDVRGRNAFVFRARSDDAVLHAESISARFTDGSGRTSIVSSPGLAGLPVRNRFTDLRVPLSELVSGGLDLRDLVSVELRFEGRGSVLVDDLRFE